jgi:arginine utilization regulatory protein
MGRSILDIFPSLTPETSTMLTVLKTGKPIYERHQTYLNNKGKQIDTINSTIPVMISPGKQGALEIAKNITKEKELKDKLVYLHQELASKDIDDKNLKGYTFRNLIGEDEKFLNSVEIAKKAAMSSSTVLIFGETGTGKELFAQSIHNESSRKHRTCLWSQAWKNVKDASPHYFVDIKSFQVCHRLVVYDVLPGVVNNIYPNINIL